MYTKATHTHTGVPFLLSELLPSFPVFLCMYTAYTEHMYGNQLAFTRGSL